MNGEFRVWCKNKNEWEKDEVLMTTNGNLYSRGNRCNLIPLSRETHVVEHCTSKKDKDGERIYNGDVVSVGKYGVLKVVEWSNDKSSFIAVNVTDLKNRKFWEVGHLLKSEYMDRYKVIGNIHENPELLEG